MKYRSIFFLVLLVAVGIHLPVFGQIEVKTAELIDSFGAGPNGDFRGRADLFMTMLANQPDSQGLIVIYGSPLQVNARKRLCMNHFMFRRFPAERIRYQVGGNVSEFRTDLWLVPARAAPPDIEPEAWIFKEVGRATKSAVVKAFANTSSEANRVDNHQTYIINYSTPAQVAQRERWLRNAIAFRRFDSSRITLVNGGAGAVRMVMWLVPPGAENPKP